MHSLLPFISFLTALCIVLMLPGLKDKDARVATGSFWPSGNHSCWKLADSRPRSTMDLRRNLVIRTKSVEYMPFYLSLSTFLMSTSFFLYGIFNFDPFIYAPNGIGTILGIIQLALYFHYKTKSVEESGEPLVVSYA
ncbi:hypothetical protein V6N11_079112 [Hibiscus sabdariffa]|uniref:Uncharacterized protein n=1 Tax=Hibiscus sabdariffa TaxID=183260 RepID=A0ABR2RUH3_9ROSI